jgi:hypothetical protein
VGEDEWETKSVLPVSFAVLVSPTKDHMSDIVELRKCQLFFHTQIVLRLKFY